MEDNLEYRFYIASDEGNFRVLDELRFQVNPNCPFPNHYGYTSLHRAVWDGLTSVVDYLLALPNLDVNQRNVWGNTPLVLAQMQGRTSVTRQLLEHPQVDLNAQKGTGGTILWWAVCVNCPGTIELLLACGKPLDIYRGARLGDDGKYMTPMELAHHLCFGDVQHLLEGYQANPATMRQVLRKKLGTFFNFFSIFFSSFFFLVLPSFSSLLLWH